VRDRLPAPRSCAQPPVTAGHGRRGHGPRVRCAVRALRVVASRRLVRRDGPRHPPVVPNRFGRPDQVPSPSAPARSRRPGRPRPARRRLPARREPTGSSPCDRPADDQTQARGTFGTSRTDAHGARSRITLASTATSERSLTRGTHAWPWEHLPHRSVWQRASSRCASDGRECPSDVTLRRTHGSRSGAGAAFALAWNPASARRSGRSSASPPPSRGPAACNAAARALGFFLDRYDLTLSSRACDGETAGQGLSRQPRSTSAMATEKTAAAATSATSSATAMDASCTPAQPSRAASTR
jgi:hypothetical protein